MHDFFNTMDRKLLMSLSMAVFFLLGAMLGYSSGMAYESSLSVDRSSQVTREIGDRVLGVSVGNEYVNPFENLDVKNIKFPVDQLKNCRNFQECHSFCSEVENYQTCVAWLHSQ